MLEERSRGRQSSFDFRVVLLVAAVSVFIFLLGVWRASCSGMPALTQEPGGTGPRSLYHQAWLETSRNIYSQDGLNNWKSWEHRYDSQIKTWEDAERCTKEMLDTLDDPRTRLMNPETVRAFLQRTTGTAVGVGLVFYAYGSPSGVLLLGADHRPMPQNIGGYPMVGRVISNSPAASAGLTAGDIVKSIHGKSVHGKSMDQVRVLLSDKTTPTVTLVLERNGQELQAVLTTEKVHEPPVVVKRLTPDIGYIRLETFIQNDAAVEFEKGLNRLSRCKAIVVDLRSNLGGSIDTAFDVTSLLLSQGIICETFSRIPGGDYKQTLYTLTPDGITVDSTPAVQMSLSISTLPRVEPVFPDKPVVILTNCYSASASELVTGALRDNGRSTVVGTTTLGKGVGQTMIPLTNGYRLSVTSMRYLTPHGTWLGDATNTVACGIRPDVEVLPNPGLVYGSANDNQLKAAVTLLAARLRQQALVVTPGSPSSRCHHQPVHVLNTFRRAAHYH